MTLKEYYNKYRGQIRDVVIATFLISMFVGTGLVLHDIGYEKGIHDVSEPVYDIQVTSFNMNYTMYNMTFNMFTNQDIKSNNWVLDIEPRDDYFAVAIRIEAKSTDWSRFVVYFGPFRQPSGWNLTIELVSIVTQYSGSDTVSSSRVTNYYDGAYGGTLCYDISTVYFLGYGSHTIGIGSALTNTISIRGLLD